MFKRLREHLKRLAGQWGTSLPSTCPRVCIEPLEMRLQLSGVAEADGAKLLASGRQTAVPAGSLLPDLVVWTSRGRRYLHGWTLDQHTEPGRVLLRLTTAIANIGKGPLELRGGAASGKGQPVFQRVFQQNGKHLDRPAGVFTYHKGHTHIHFDDFALYRLRQVTAKETVGRVVRSGRKVSFCLTDSNRFHGRVANASPDGDYFTCSGRRQGISVGWADVYSSSLADQWIDVTGVRNGQYWLEVVVDPDNRLVEANERNNVARIKITLRLPAKPATPEPAP